MFSASCQDLQRQETVKEHLPDILTETCKLKITFGICFTQNLFIIHPPRGRGVATLGVQ